MTPSTLQETVTVTGEAPLIETSTSSVGGNIDPRQMSELPVEGRNWMSLALLAPGNRTTAEGALPVQDRTNVREFELNVDGALVTANMGAGNQPRYSKDSIAEFQFISNRFDASQGRSSGDLDVLWGELGSHPEGLTDAQADAIRDPSVVRQTTQSFINGRR